MGDNSSHFPVAGRGVMGSLQLDQVNPGSFIGHKSSKAGGSGCNCPGWESGGNAHYLIAPDLHTKVVPINGVGGGGSPRCHCHRLEMGSPAAGIGSHLRMGRGERTMSRASHQGGCRSTSCPQVSHEPLSTPFRGQSWAGAPPSSSGMGDDDDAKETISPKTSCSQVSLEDTHFMSPDVTQVPRDPIQGAVVGRSTLSISWLEPGVGDDDGGDDDDAKEVVNPNPAPQ